MPIKSYLAYPHDGGMYELEYDLRKIQFCEVMPSPSHDVLVLITDTLSDESDKEVHDEIRDLKSLKDLSIVSESSSLNIK